MTTPLSAVYDYIVKELAPNEHEPDEASITIVCEPLSAVDRSSPPKTIAMRLKAGTTLEEARAIARTLQTQVKGLCQLEVTDDAA